MLLAIIKVIDDSNSLKGIKIDEKINMKYHVQPESEDADNKAAGLEPTELLNQITVLKELGQSVTY